MFQMIVERVRKEHTASAPSPMEIRVFLPTDGKSTLLVVNASIFCGSHHSVTAPGPTAFQLGWLRGLGRHEG